jgi:hypothetical protein
MVPGLRFAFGRPLVLLLVFTAVLFACFAIDPLRVLDDAQHEVFSDGGLRLVRQRILSTTPETPFLYPGVTSPEQTRLYLSQAGLPGILAAWAAPETQEARLVFLERLAVLVAFLTAFVLAAFFASAAEHFGLIPTAIAVLLTCMSPHLLGFSRSLFFSPFLFFIPFVISWLLYPGWVRERQHVFAFHLLIAAAVAVKCLSGYEYFTTTAVGAIVPVIYFEWDRLERWRAPVLQSLKVLVAGAAGFFVAITLHGLQLYHLFGREGVAVILDRATQRTVGDTRTADQLYAAYEKLLGKLPPDSLVHRIAESLNETLLIGSGVFSRYFLLPAINLPGSQEGRMERVDVYVPIGLVVLLVFAVVAWLLRRGVDLENRKHRLALVTALSLLAPLSWQILAFGHMIPHIGLNSIVFYVPFLILAYLLLGCVVASLARSLPMRL